MMDPPDRELDLFREGEEGIYPDPEFGPDGERSLEDYTTVIEKLPRVWRVNLVTTVAGAEDFWDINDRPEYWIVSVRPVASGVDPLTSVVWVWLGRNPAGMPVECVSGKKVILPSVGNSTAICWRVTGAASATLNIAAVRGYDAASLA